MEITLNVFVVQFPILTSQTRTRTFISRAHRAFAPRIWSPEPNGWFPRMWEDMDKGDTTAVGHQTAIVGGQTIQHRAQQELESETGKRKEKETTGTPRA
jgi:hypothetical protein